MFMIRQQNRSVWNTLIHTSGNTCLSLYKCIIIIITIIAIILCAESISLSISPSYLSSAPEKTHTHTKVIVPGDIYKYNRVLQQMHGAMKIQDIKHTSGSSVYLRPHCHYFYGTEENQTRCIWHCCRSCYPRRLPPPPRRWSRRHPRPRDPCLLVLCLSWEWGCECASSSYSNLYTALNTSTTAVWAPWLIYSS